MSRRMEPSDVDHCAGWTTIIEPTRCYSPPIYRVTRPRSDKPQHYVCGLHLSRAVRELTADDHSVTVDPL